MSELPFDLLVEILARLPVKDVIRFKRVSKKWRLLFEEERFISQHTTLAPSTFLVRDLGFNRNYIYEYNDGSFKRNMIVQNRDFNMYPRNTPFDAPFDVVGHCNGLFCLLFGNDTVVVWNPSLRESRTIPTLSQKHYYNHYHVGFGYDHSTEDYKILLIPRTINNCHSQAEILTLKSSPRKFDFPYRKDFYNNFTPTNGTLVGDYLFWQLAYNESDKTNETILSFHIVSEKINYTSSPCSGNDGHVVLTLFRRRLCMLNHLSVDRSMYSEIIVWCADHEEKDFSRVKS